MKIDILKYGFALKGTSECGIQFYERRITPNIIVNLMVATNIYSLSYTTFEDNGDTYFEAQVANRYRIDTQSEFDFLILNGRVGWGFATKESNKN